MRFLTARRPVRRIDSFARPDVASLPQNSLEGIREIGCRGCSRREDTMPKKSPPPNEPHPITAPKIRRLAGIATATPSKLTTKQTQELGASVLRHIEPRGGKIK
jgi:hypothetical protein